MRIASATVQLESSHEKQQHHEIRESINVWRRQRDLAENAPGSGTVHLSDEGRTAQSNEANTIGDAIDAARNDPTLSLIRTLVALLLGHDVDVFDRSVLPSGTASTVTDGNQGQNPSRVDRNAPSATGFGLEYDRHESFSENEHTRFEASGTIVTADGEKIRFAISLDMSRSYQEESDVSIRAGEPRQRKDPLVINFSGNAAQLRSERFQFDIDADGVADSINFVAGGSGFLALDRNSDGIINDGTELFGAKSGDGFSELSQLDSDKNGWIDEGDAAYSQLLVWTKNSSGQDQLSTLKQAGIGAISLANVGTPFELKGADNALNGQIRATGIYLHENGEMGTMQQIDLMV